ncbi:hypothetical protein ACHAXT_012933 [Thalassiosira profunda]
MASWVSGKSLVQSARMRGAAATTSFRNASPTPGPSALSSVAGCLLGPRFRAGSRPRLPSFHADAWALKCHLSEAASLRWMEGAIAASATLSSKIATAAARPRSNFASGIDKAIGRGQRGLEGNQRQLIVAERLPVGWELRFIGGDHLHVLNNGGDNGAEMIRPRSSGFEANRGQVHGATLGQAGALTVPGYEGEALALGLCQSHERVAFMHGMSWRVLLHSWPGVRCSNLVLTGRIWCWWAMTSREIGAARLNLVKREAGILWAGAQREAIALEVLCGSLLTNARDGTGDDGTANGTVESGRGADEEMPGVAVEVPGLVDVDAFELAGRGVPVRELAETTGASGRSSGVRIVDAFEVEVEVEMSAQFEPLVVGRCQQNREGAGIHFCAPARPQAIPYLPFRELARRLKRWSGRRADRGSRPRW